MDSRLEEIVRLSYAYDIDQKEVAQIVEKFINLPLDRLLNASSKNIEETIRFYAEVFLNDENGLDTRFTDCLDYTELLCLLDSTAFGSFTYNETEHRIRRIDDVEDDSNNFILFDDDEFDSFIYDETEWIWENDSDEIDDDNYTYCGLHLDIGLSMPKQFRARALWSVYSMIKKTADSDVLVKSLLSIKVWAFFQYLAYKGSKDREPTDRMIMDMQQRLIQVAESIGIDISRDMTIGDVLKRAANSSESWSPWYPLAHYCGKILCIHKIYSILLLDCFKAAYPEKFDLKKIIDKYKNKMKEE